MTVGAVTAVDLGIGYTYVNLIQRGSNCSEVLKRCAPSPFPSVTGSGRSWELALPSATSAANRCETTIKPMVATLGRKKCGPDGLIV